jgi:hypothetical protein
MIDTEQTPQQREPRAVRVDSYSGCFNMLRPDKKYKVIRVWLPDDAPESSLDETWDDGDEPTWQDRPAMEVIDLIEARVESAWFISDRGKKREIIAWCRKNEAAIDRKWAEHQVALLQKRIDSAQQRIAELTENYIETEE